MSVTTITEWHNDIELDNKRNDIFMKEKELFLA